MEVRLEKLCAWIMKDKLHKTAAQGTNLFTINGATARPAQHHPVNQSKSGKTAMIFTLAEYVFMSYKRTSVNFHITIGCAAIVARKGIEIHKSD